MSVYKQAGVFLHNLYLFYTQFVFYSTDELYCDPIWYNITWGHALVHLVVELSNLLCTAPEPPYLTTRETSRKRWKVYPNVNIHTHTYTLSLSQQKGMLRTFHLIACFKRRLIAENYTLCISPVFPPTPCLFFLCVCTYAYMSNDQMYSMWPNMYFWLCVTASMCVHDVCVSA